MIVKIILLYLEVIANRLEFLYIILIQQEAFKPANNDFYERYNIVGIGDVLKKELEKNYNVEVIHDKTIHNTTYIESYKRSGETLDKYLSEIKILI